MVEVKLTNFLKETIMVLNRGVAYVRPGEVEIQSIPFPELVYPRGRDAHHGVILKLNSSFAARFTRLLKAAHISQ